MSCKHENADHLKPGEVFYPAYGSLGEYAVTCEQFRCIDCGAWLPLGPSNDGDERVKVEVRAAEIAADLDGEGCWMAPFERWGFNDEYPTLRGGGKLEVYTTGQQSGYLARQIATHQDGEQ